jgi:hypothetical protein
MLVVLLYRRQRLGSRFGIVSRLSFSLRPGTGLLLSQFDAFRNDYETLYRVHREAEDDFFYVGSAYWGIPWLEAILGCALQVGETSCWGEISPSHWDLLQEELSPIGLSIQPIIKLPENIRRYP